MNWRALIGLSKSEERAMDENEALKAETQCCGNPECGCKTVDNGSHPDYKYAEDKILLALKRRVDATYQAHYAVDNSDMQLWDVWLALGGVTETARNTAIKYLWRYGQKNGSDPEDLFKAIHFTMLALYSDHYKE